MTFDDRFSCHWIPGVIQKIPPPPLPPFAIDMTSDSFPYAMITVMPLFP